MNIEDRLRSALEADEGAWPQESWSGFRERAAASRRRRAVTVGLALAVVAAAIAFSSTAVWDEAGPDFAGGNRHVDARTGYSVEIPPGWTTKEAVEGERLWLQGPHAEGEAPPVELFLNSDPGRAWSDVVTWYGGDLWRAMRLDGVTLSSPHDVRVGTHGAVMVEIQFADTPRPANPASPGWCRGCTSRHYVVDWDRLTVLRIAVTSPGPVTFQQNVETIDRLIDSIQTFEGPGLYTPKGTAAATIQQTPALRALLRFMDARVERSGAESWLASPEVAPSAALYGPLSDPIAGYFVSFGEEVDGAARYTVCPADRGAAWIARERIDVRLTGDTFRVVRLDILDRDPQSCFEPE